MKKTVLAAAALAALSSTAFAQSSVTLYGVVDASFESVRSNGSVTRVSSDNLATSRIGFKGTEDLGGGLKANFVLESGIKSDTGVGVDSGNRLFSRAAWVGLASNFGELRLGRQDSLIGAQAASVAGTQGYDDFKIAKTYAGDTYRRLDNAVTYVAPTFFPGLSAAVQYSTAASSTVANNSEALSTSDKGRLYALSIGYAAGPIGAGIAYQNVNNDTLAGAAPFAKTATNKEKTVQAYASYDFAVVKATVYYSGDDNDVSGPHRNLAGIKLAVPVTSAFKVTGAYSQVKGVDFIKGEKAQIFALKGQYDLSKRTALYALTTTVKNDDNSQLTINGGAAEVKGRNSSGFAVGVAHSF